MGNQPDLILLDALAVAAGVWLVNPPDSTLGNSKRNILPSEIRLEAVEAAGITQFVEQKPVEIEAIGDIGDRIYQWCRKINVNGSRTSNADAKEVIDRISHLFEREQAGSAIWFPVIAYYGAGRALPPSNAGRKTVKLEREISRRWDAFYDCF